MKRNLFFMYAISFFQGMVFYSSIATLYRQAAGLLFAAAIYTVFIGENYRVAGFLTVVSYGIAAILSFGLKEVKAAQRDEKMSFGHSFTILKEKLFNRRLFFLIAGFALLREVFRYKEHAFSVLWF